jgi:hypothetical protein
MEMGREREMEMAREMEMGRDMYRFGDWDSWEWRQRDKRKNERKLFLRQYIDTTMHLAPIGDAVRICCVLKGIDQWEKRWVESGSIQ